MVGNFVCLLGALGLLGRRFIGRIVLRVPWGFHSDPGSLGERSTLSASLSSPELPGLAFMVSRYCDTKSKNALLEGGLSDVFLGDTLVHPSAPIRGGSTHFKSLVRHLTCDFKCLVKHLTLRAWPVNIPDDFKSLVKLLTCDSRSWHRLCECVESRRGAAVCWSTRGDPLTRPN